MVMQLAEQELVEPRTVPEAAASPSAATAPDPIGENEHQAVARGIMAAVLISTPFWALLAFTIYMVL
jgi:hypothetical protein